MQIDRLDHLALTVSDVQRTVAFYTKVLGMHEETFRGGQRALTFGRQKINVHEAGREPTLRAEHPTPGSGDLCFITTSAMEGVQQHLADCDVAIEMGPVARKGALGPIQSVYIRDPDANLVEISTY
jgi:catechol 2,3-dioxygenase-like lactoylglutathione lyase family enzyme